MRVGRSLFVACVVGGAVATAIEGCGAGATANDADVCIARAACLKAPAPTDAEQQQCHTLVNEPQCGAAYKTMKECQTYRAQCTSSGTVNSSGTSTTCRSEVAAYNFCRGASDAGPDGCRPRTCSQAGANCGEIDDNCGGKLNCGTCANGQTCGGGTPNRCGCKCDPTWCGTLVACNTTITCPNNCVAPQWCGGGGVANRCGCVAAGSVGPLSSTSVTTAVIALDGGSQASWSGASNARLSDNSNASASLSVGSTTQYLVALSFAAALPAEAIIEGITVQVERSSTAGLATIDRAVHLVKNTQIQTAGDNKALAGVWPTAETTVTYGGPTDKWGNTWTAAEVNAGGFGVAFAATYNGMTGGEQARVDAIRVTVHYSGVNCP